MARIDRILKAVEADSWAIEPKKLAVLAEILAAKADSGQLPTQSDIDAAEARLRGESSRPMGGTVAVLPMYGTMSRRMGMLGAMSGGLSVETFSKAFAELVDDQSVSAIVLDVDSPGGSVFGVEELSRQIFEARSSKRIIAVANQLMASGAFYAASSATEVVVSPSGIVGSVGVFSVHFDFSEALEMEGIKVTIIKAGERKAEGNQFEVLSDEAEAHMQSMNDAFYAQFINALARNFGTTAAVIEETFGQGLAFDAKRALERGMVHRIATLDEVLADLTGGAAITQTPIAAVTRTVDIAASDSLVPGGLAEVLSGVAGSIEKSITGTFDNIEVFDPTAIELKASEIEEKPDVAAGHATEVPITAPTKPAPEAREDTMDGKSTEAQPVGANDVEAALTAERARISTIQTKAREHGITEDTIAAWVGDGTDLATVNASILDVLKERQKDSKTVVVGGQDRAANKPFENLGMQLTQIIRAAQQPGSIDPRLTGLNAAASGSGSVVPSDGGFLLQPEFATEILRRVYTLGEVVSRVRRRPIGPNANGLKINAVDETSRVTGSRYGGIQVYWEGEGDTATAKKPKFRQMELYLRKLLGIWYVTDELMEDSVALQAIGEDAFSEEVAFMIEDAIFRGTGAGQPLGFLNSNALVSVDAESAQTAATINATNVVKMLARMWPRSRTNAVWFINVDAEPQLPLMTIGTMPVYLPPGGLRDSPYGNLLGRPVIPVEYCQTVGTVGDIVLADLDQYLMIDKGAAQQAWSMHVRFLNDEQTFRITYRVDGQPAWTSALTPYKGSNTLSPFVVLATRS